MIELLIVVAIIGIIVTFAIIFLSQSKAKARDAKRLTDIKQIGTILELYRADESTYPASLTPGQGLVGPTSGTTYCKIIPTNPLPSTDGSCLANEYTYTQTLSGQGYDLTYCLGQATQNIAAGTNTAKPYNIAASCEPNCTGKCGGEADGCGGSCAGTVAYDGGPYDANGTTQTTGGYYRTVLIGAQCWFKDNLNAGTMIGSKLADNSTLQNQTNNGTIEKYCYGYTQQDNAGQIITGQSNCATYGGFYQWPEAVQYSNGVTLTTGTSVAGGNIQGICPSGWHVPSDTEWSTLSTALGGDAASGNAIKEAGSTHWTSGNTGTNSSGFTALGAGYRYNVDGSFSNSGVLIFFTSTLAQGSDSSYWRRPYYSNATLSRSAGNRASGYSVRCLRD